LASSSRNLRKRFVMTLFSFSMRALSCIVSREMFSGRSSLSTTPFRKRSHSGSRVFRLGVDEDLAAVEGDALFEAGEAELLGVFLRDEEEGVDRERGVGAEMQAEAGLVEGVGLELVELGVFLVLDLVLAAQPEGLDGVDAFAVEVDRERDEGAVALEDFLHLPVLGEVGASSFSSMTILVPRLRSALASSIS
jgi:hypothetical protein